MQASITFNVDLSRPGVACRAYAVQGEKDSRVLVFRLLEGGVVWSIPDGAAAICHYRRSNGSGGSFSTGISTEGNMVTVTLSEGVCANAGPVTLTVELSKDDVVIVTWPILVTVIANPGSQDPMDFVEAVRWEPNKYLGTDESGSVVARDAPEGGVETAEEKPIHMDLSGYYDGTIVLEYADGGTMDVAVTFDADGNPVSFSNGTEEFTVTWPAEEATEATEEETA